METNSILILSYVNFGSFLDSWRLLRLMTMSPLYPSGNACSAGFHNETVKKLTLFCAFINQIMMESRLRISNPWECHHFFNRIENFNHLYDFITYAITIVNLQILQSDLWSTWKQETPGHKSRGLLCGD